MTHIIVSYYKAFSICKEGCNIRAVPISLGEVESASQDVVKERREGEEEESKAKISDLDVLALSLVVWGSI